MFQYLLLCLSICSYWCSFSNIFVHFTTYVPGFCPSCSLGVGYTSKTFSIWSIGNLFRPMIYIHIYIAKGSMWEEVFVVTTFVSDKTGVSLTHKWTQMSWWMWCGCSDSRQVLHWTHDEACQLHLMCDRPCVLFWGVTPAGTRRCPRSWDLTRKKK